MVEREEAIWVLGRDEVARTEICRILVEGGYPVRSLANLQQLDLHEPQDHPLPVLLVLDLPAVDDGVEALLGELRRLHVLDDVPLLLIVDGEERSRDGRPDQRVDGLLCRPLQPLSLLSYVRTLAQLRAARARASHVPALAEFAHTVSHELKSPLAGLVVSAQVLASQLQQLQASPRGRSLPASPASPPPLDGKTLQRVNELAQVTQSSAKRCLALIDALLERAESSVEARLRPAERADGDQALRQVIQERGPSLVQAGMEVAVEGELGAWPMRAHHLRQVLGVLLDNAIAFNDSARPRLDVTAPSGPGQSQRRLVLQDNGPGFPWQVMQWMFRPRLNGNDGKLSLGLFVARQILALYGGELLCSNEGGARVELVLPAAAGLAPHALQPGSRPPPAGPGDVSAREEDATA